mgnify:CR=1 FL=1
MIKLSIRAGAELFTASEKVTVKRGYLEVAEKDTKDEGPSESLKEMDENYDDYDYGDEYVFGAALGNFKDEL